MSDDPYRVLHERISRLQELSERLFLENQKLREELEVAEEVAQRIKADGCQCELCHPELTPCHPTVPQCPRRPGPA